MDIISNPPTSDLTLITQIKDKALSIVNSQLFSPNSSQLDPKELKTLVDITLNLEDSYRHPPIGEGENVRKLKRLVDKYSDDD